jgi:hypothetical protein
MFIEISIGEGLDRLSILEIKQREIKCIDKLDKIKKEINSLSELNKYMKQYLYYYDLLIIINTKIWNNTNIIKKLDYNTIEFARMSNSIFEFNQSRFRLKNIINRLTDSNIQEQKSYDDTSIDVELLSIHDINIDYFTNLSLSYDIVRIKCTSILQKKFNEIIPKFNYLFV